MAEYPGVIDITDSFRSGKQELKLRILPSGEALGLSLGNLARQVRQAFYGEEAQRIQRGRPGQAGLGGAKRAGGLQPATCLAGDAHE
ncbi:MAG: hypothetical protein QGH99_07195, partial [Pseudomonadales bacterium]|nr:hypothetical protein [Pseudomonadales bacterium]